MPRANPQQDKKYYSCHPRQTHGDFHNKIGPGRQLLRRSDISGVGGAADIVNVLLGQPLLSSVRRSYEHPVSPKKHT